MGSLGLAMAEASRGGRDQVKFQYTIGEVGTSASRQATLQDSNRNLDNKVASPLASVSVGLHTVEMQIHLSVREKVRYLFLLQTWFRPLR